MKTAFTPIAKRRTLSPDATQHPVGVIVPLYIDKIYGLGFIAVDDIVHYYQPQGINSTWTRVERKKHAEDQEQDKDKERDYTVVGIHFDDFRDLLALAVARQDVVDCRTVGEVRFDPDVNMPLKMPPSRRIAPV